ncbi:MAG: ATPase domain-containing protein [Candidatus Bathyarchaeia archaeon]
MLQKIPTGCEVLDEILEGGFSIGEISLIYGEEDTAKTTLAMQCAINCARLGYKTLFIDCDGTFSIERLAQLALDLEKIAELIILSKPEDFSEQTMIIDRLPDYLTKNFGLVIIDTLTSLYRAKVAEKPERVFELNRELNRQMAWLAQTAKTHKVAIIVVSQVRSVVNESFNGVMPVADRVLKFWADTIIAMKTTGNPRVIKAQVERKNRKETSEFCYLRIEEAGLCPFKTG